MPNEIRFTRLTNSTKLTDRYLTVQMKLPTENSDYNKGRIFALVEITNPWFPNSHIGQAIINTLSKEYYQLPNNDYLTNFEAAIKKVNETLAQITQRGETDWIGNLNSVLALVVDNEIHMTQSGKGEVFLFRDQKINHITSESPQEVEPHPLKTFSNIISGELNKNDRLLIASPSLLDYLSQKELQEIISNGSPYDATQEMAQFLRKEKAKHINTIIIETISKVDLENQPLSDKDEVIYLDQANSLGALFSSTKKYSSQISPALSEFGKNLVLFGNKISEFFHHEIKPRAKIGWEKTKDISKKGYDHLTKKTAPKLKEMATPIAKNIHSGIKNSLSSLSAATTPKEKEIEPNKPFYSVNYYEGSKEKSSLLSKKLEPIFQNTKLSYNKTFRKLREGFDWLFAKNNRSVIYAGIAILLVIILVVNISELRKRQVAKKNEQTQAQQLESIKSQFEEAKLSILYNDMSKAKTQLDDVIKKALEIMNAQPKLADQAKAIINDADKEFDRLTSTTRFDSPKTIADFTDVSEIFVLGDKLVAINKNNNNLFFTKSDGSDKISSLQRLDPPSLDKGLYQAASYDTKDNVIYTLTNSSLFKISDPANQPENLNLAKGTWEQATDIASFLGNLYLLSPSKGQIFKYASGANGYGAATNYIDTSKVDLKNSISIAIDGSIYILKSDNSIIKFSKNNLQDFNLKDIPTPTDKITKGKKIWTTSEINSLFVLDGNRILELDKTGKFLHQYAFSPDLQNISDFFIQPTEKIIWVLNNKKVYKVSY